MSEALRKIEASWRALNDTIDSVSPERLKQPGASGHWSVRDVLAHIAVWDDIQVDKIELMKNGASLPEWEGFQAINDREHAARAGWSLEQARSEMHAAHERMLAALATVPDIDPEEVKDDTWGHYDEHAAWIRKWLAS